MSNILIINLKRYGDIFSTAHLINSLVEKNPTTNISLLVYEEFASAAKNLSNVKEVFTVDRKQILTYKKNDIFSDGFAIEAFFNQIQKIKNSNWDKVLNYSNDKVSTYLTSYLASSTEEVVGMKFSNKINAKASSEWDLVLNEVLTTYPETPINFVDTYHHMMNVERVNDGQKLTTSTSHNESAFKNINYIRKTEAKEGKNLNIVGIQLFSSQEEKSIPRKVLIDLIQNFVSDDEYYPILLLAPTTIEREFAAAVNKEFDNKLVSVEADFKAIPSVLLNVDLLVTPDTAIKHVADLVDTPLVEVSLGASPLFKQGTVNEASVILTPRVDTRSFSQKELSEKGASKFTVTAYDIMEAVKRVVNPDSQVHLSHGLSLYQPKRDELGTYYSCIAGEYDLDKESRRLMARQVLAELFDIDNKRHIHTKVSSSFSTDLIPVLNEEKASVTKSTKSLLGTLRSLLQTNENKKKIPDFVSSLDSLLAEGDNHHLTAIPILIFRSRIESLESSSFTESIKEVESLLYELKADIQKVYSCIKDIELHILEDKKERLQEKYSQSTSSIQL